MTESITWIVARGYNGSDAIVSEASSENTVSRFLAKHEGKIIDHITRPVGVHWDGGKLTDAEARRINAGLRRNS